jgi:hypothetical protein
MNRLIIAFALVAAGFTPAVAAVAGTASAAAARPAPHGVAAPASGGAGGSRLWVQRFTSGTGREASASSVVVSPDRSIVYVTGESNQVPLHAPAITTVAYDAITGAQLWQASYEGPPHHAGGPPSLAISPGGARLFVAGAIHLPRHGVHFVVLAYNAKNGSLLWSTISQEGTELAQVQPVAATATQVFVTGSSNNRLGPVYLTEAFDAITGNLDWTATAPFPAFLNFHNTCIAVSPDGSAVFVAGGLGIIAFRTSDGSVLWKDRYKRRWGRTAASMAVSRDGSAVFVTGQARSRTVPPQFLTSAYNAATGAQLWQARYRGMKSAMPGSRSVAISPDGTRVFVTGSAFDVKCCNLHMVTIAYAATTGARVWTATYFGPGISAAAGTVVADPNGSEVFVSGDVEKTGSGNPTEFATIAYSTATGAQLWAATYTPKGQSSAQTAMAVSHDGARVFVTGTTLLPTSTTEALTVAYLAS